MTEPALPLADPTLAGLPTAAVTSIVVALIAAVSALVGAAVNAASERSLRRRLDRDIEAWKRLPVGCQPRRALFDHIGRQVEALTTRGVEEQRTARWALRLLLATLTVMAMGLAAVTHDPAPQSLLYRAGLSMIAISPFTLVATAVAWVLSRVHRARRRGTGS